MARKLVSATALVAALVTMGVAATGARAVTATFSPAGVVSMTGTTTFTGGSTTVACPLTLRTLIRVSTTVALGFVMGEILGATVGTCSGGAFERLQYLPWLMTIQETLPSIGTLTTTNATGLRLGLNGAGIAFSIFGGFVNCLYHGTWEGLLAMTATARGEARYTARTLRWLENVEIALERGALGCPAAIHLAGTMTLSTTQTITLS